MINKDPEGYRKLLVYQKAQKLHSDLLAMLEHFPKTLYKQTHYANLQLKTIADLIDQMPRSARSTHKNIVEGWKRNTTKEYFEFLGFSIGSSSELKDDAADIVTGKYKELMGIKGVMGERGDPSYPFGPLHPIIYTELNKIPFYPLNQNLPPAVRIFLQAKEVDFLLHKLQKSLDTKMDQEHTKSARERFDGYLQDPQQRKKEYDAFLKSQGLRRLEDGRVVEIEQVNPDEQG